MSLKFHKNITYLGLNHICYFSTPSHHYPKVPPCALLSVSIILWSEALMDKSLFIPLLNYEFINNSSALPRCRDWRGSCVELTGNGVGIREENSNNQAQVHCELQITPDIPKALEISELWLWREKSGLHPSSSACNKSFLFLTCLWDVWKFQSHSLVLSRIQISQKRKLEGLKMGGES